MSSDVSDGHWEEAIAHPAKRQQIFYPHATFSLATATIAFQLHDPTCYLSASALLLPLLTHNDKFLVFSYSYSHPAPLINVNVTRSLGLRSANIDIEMGSGIRLNLTFYFLLEVHLFQKNVTGCIS